MTFLEKSQLSGDVAMGAAEVIEFQTATLPILIDRASRALLEAKNSAEVLEARELARAAYDAAKAAGRMARVRQAHSEVLAAVRRSQADALEIQARAEMRLADEYDAAQERGEIGQSGARTDLVPDGNEVTPSAADAGLSRKGIHEGRKLRDAEKASPGKTKAAIETIVARGEEPTRAKVQREVVEKPLKLAKQSASPVDADRRKLEKLTPEALVDEVLGLRADLADAKAKAVRLTAECAALKIQVKELGAGDSTSVIRNLQVQVKNAESARWREGEKTKDALKQVYALKKELKRIGAVEIPL